MVVVNIDLTKINQDTITEGKNGEKYYSFIVTERKAPDAFGNTHSVYEGQTKEQREAKVDRNYIGSGKEYTFTPTAPAPPPAPATAPIKKVAPKKLPF
jgi:hypothetical protein